MSSTPAPLLDELELLVVMDNETDTLSTVDPGVDQIPEHASLLARTPPSRVHEGHACVTVFDKLCVACHGFSVLMTARQGDSTRRILFDIGPYGDMWLDNASRLGVDLSEIEAVFLSHWHADHSGGFPAVVGSIARARSASGLAPPIVDLHPNRPDQRGVQIPGGGFVLLQPEPTFAEIESVGGDIRLNDESHLVADLVLASGEIPRVTTYETGLPGHHRFDGDNASPDPLILDERLLLARVRGRGTTVLSACSHAGIVNACVHARELAASDAIDLVLGGYHLAGGGMEARIPATVDDLDRIVAPRTVAPGHCTGWRAKAALSARFAPGRYGPSSVGTRYCLTAG